MVFEPTFDEIDRESVELPDETGAEPGADRTEPGGGLAEGAPAADEAQDDAVEGEAEATIAAGDVTANDLPPYGN